MRVVVVAWLVCLTNGHEDIEYFVLAIGSWDAVKTC